MSAGSGEWQLAASLVILIRGSGEWQLASGWISRVATRIANGGCDSWEIKQLIVLGVAADRGAYSDQSQPMRLRQVAKLSIRRS